MKSITLCEAKCGKCTSTFGHGWLGEFAYGEAVFTTNDGLQFAVANAFTDFAQRVSVQVSKENAHFFWPTLAALADPIQGKPLTHAIVCPNCGSTELAHWGGSKVGSVAYAEATFLRSERLNPVTLARRVAEIQKRHRDA